MINYSKDKLDDNIIIICRYCDMQNPVYRHKCTLCGRNLSGKIDIIDRRSLIIDNKEVELQMHGKEALKRAKQPRRKSPRLSLTIFPGELEVTAGTNKGLKDKNITVLDLSREGMLFKSKLNLSKNTKVKIRFKLPSQDEQVEVVSKVFRSMKIPGLIGKNGLVVLFSDVDTEIKNKIFAYIEEHIS
ncbi:MAG: PilZ domain-containing protein [Pseudomonadota bacterium]